LARFGLRAQPTSSGSNTSHPAKEAFRVLRSNLLVTLPQLDDPIVVITSARSQEGKTTTCVSLAQSLAAAGSRVALVDLDLRSPTAHDLIGARRQGGVSDVLLDRRPLDDCLQYVEFGVTASARPAGMCFLSAGNPVDSPAELLSTPRVGKLLERLAAATNIVLVDAPPVLAVADTLVIGRLASGAVLVVEANRTPVPAIKQAKDALTRNQTRLLGVVLNKFKFTVPPETYGSGAGDFGGLG
jgi:capsular exopolysaccharide synthesis family protein